MKKRFLLGIAVGVMLTLLGTWLFLNSPQEKNGFVSPLGNLGRKEKPLLKYTFEALRQRQYSGSEIGLDRVLKQDKDYTTWAVFFESDGKKISGTLDLPATIASPSAGTSLSALTLKAPIVIMLHGFADQKEYYPGFGTEKVAAVLAKNGYVTLAPDFAGHGESDPPSKDDFEDRFQTYTTVLNLIATLERNCLDYHGLVTDLHGSSSGSLASQCKIGLWGHSNGGQIALSVLAISGKSIPTALWNPVSRFFPYSILYYIDYFEDRGKYLRSSLANFEKDYDVEKYSVTNYLGWISAPIFLQQGELDDQVPKRWSDDLYQKLTDLQKSEGPSTSLRTAYKVYAGADHNLVPRWNEAVGDLLSFFAGRMM